MKDEIFDWVEFTQNFSILFGILPGLVLYLLKPKKSAVLGTLLVVASLIMTNLLVKGDSKHIADNSKEYLFAVSVMSGQGACLVLLAVLQALMNMQTILASGVLTTVLISYFLAGDSLMQMIMLSLADETQFEHLLGYLTISGGIVLILCAVVISDEEDGEGGGGWSLSSLRDKAATLT